MVFFTSDTHFGESDSRLKLMFRDGVLTGGKTLDDFLIDRWNSVVSKDDKVFHLGDFAYDSKFLSIAKKLNGKEKVLVRGNYDKAPVAELLQYFDKVLDSHTIKYGDRLFYLNHYPSRCKQDVWNLTGHVHGHWRTQRNMINVGVDVWNWAPVSMSDIARCVEAVEKHYDQDIFAGELECNTSWKGKRGKTGSYADSVKLEEIK